MQPTYLDRWLSESPKKQRPAVLSSPAVRKKQIFGVSASVTDVIKSSKPCKRNIRKEVMTTGSSNSSHSMPISITLGQAPPAKKAKISNDKNQTTGNLVAKSKAKNVATTEPVVLGRVSAKMSVTALKAECRARGLKGYTSLCKSGLVDVLGDDTICLSGTNAYKEVEKIKKQMKAEEEAHANNASIRDEKKRLRHEVIRKEEAEKEEKRVKTQLKQQEKLHTKLCPKVHPCKLAPTRELMQKDRSPRLYSATCDSRTLACAYNPTSWTCESCNFDICSGCFNLKMMSTEDRETEEKRLRKAKEEEEKRRAVEQEKRRKWEREEQKRLEKLEKEKEKKKKQFIKEIDSLPKRIKEPSKTNADVKKLKKFVVWKSNGYPYDGWHSYGGPPEKEFDSSFAKLEDANKRAEYVFYCESELGWGIEDFLENEQEIEERDVGGRKCFKANPPDSEVWKVKVDTKEGWKKIEIKKQSEESSDGERGFDIGW